MDYNFGKYFPLPCMSLAVVVVISLNGIVEDWFAIMEVGLEKWRIEICGSKMGWQSFQLTNSRTRL